MRIRVFKPDTDIQQIRECLIELQDFERQMDPRMPCGESIADSYIADMLRKCNEYHGQILVAEEHNAIAGYLGTVTK